MHGRPEGYRDASPGARIWTWRAPRPAAVVPTRRDLLRDSAPREESGERRVGGVFRGVTGSSTVISQGGSWVFRVVRVGSIDGEVLLRRSDAFLTLVCVCPAS